MGCGGDRQQGGLAKDLKLGRLWVNVGSRGQEGHPGARGWDHKDASPRPRACWLHLREAWPAPDGDMGGRGELTPGVQERTSPHAGARPWPTSEHCSPASPGLALVGGWGQDGGHGRGPRTSLESVRGGLAESGAFCGGSRPGLGSGSPHTQDRRNSVHTHTAGGSGAEAADQGAPGPVCASPSRPGPAGK